MKIQPAYATIDQSKMLKEKNYIEECQQHYQLALTSKKHRDDGYSGPFGWKRGECERISCYFVNGGANDLSNKDWYQCAAPMHWEINEWLKINHGVWIEIKPDCYGEYWYSNIAVCSKNVLDDVDRRNLITSGIEVFGNYHKTSYDAFSAALDFLLTKFI